MSTSQAILLSAIGALVTSAVHAAPPAKPAPKPKPLPRHQQIEHGPFVTATIPTQWPEGGIVNKGIAVRLTEAGGVAEPVQGGILFDTDTCRVAAAWTGGFVEFTKDWTSVRDSRSVRIIGTQVSGTLPGPGWAKPGAVDGDAWRDTREQGFGPLPRAWVKYGGLYQVRGRIVLSYTVGGTAVYELPVIETVKGHGVIARGIEVGASDTPTIVSVCERSAAMASVSTQDVAKLDSKSVATRALAMGPLPEGTKWLVSNEDSVGRIRLLIPPHKSPFMFTVRVWSGSPETVDAVAAPLIERRGHLRTVKFDLTGDAATPLSAVAKAGGPSLWPDTLATTGKLGSSDGPYAVDTITMPEDNPYKSWFRPGGFDFFKDGTSAAICNWSGDVWIVSGIDDKLEKLTWKRYASGLFQPLGLRIVDEKVYVLGRDQITRLHDLNGDGEADFYECFNNDVEVTPNFHEFTFDLHTDPDGNFLFAKGAPVRNGGRGFETIAAHHGSVLRVAKDGSKLEVVASGLRAPNGIGVSPSGQITTGDNEGSFVPKCRLNWVKPGGFYGVVPTSHRTPEPADYDRPLCWFPKDVDNSSGGQVWVTSDKWGPFQDRLLHMSYGTSSLFLVMKEEVAGQVQGGVVRFPLSFDSGIMRARFNPRDGQLYVAGLKGWQTNASKDGCFHRVRHTGKPVYMPTTLNTTKTGFAITFTAPLDPKEAADPGNYAIERWNYSWSPEYGSPDVSVDDPKRKGRDDVEVQSAKLSPDGKTVTLEVADMKPAMQMKITLSLKAADGTAMRYDVINSVHVLP